MDDPDDLTNRTIIALASDPRRLAVAKVLLHAWQAEQAAGHFVKTSDTWDEMGGWWTKNVICEAVLGNFNSADPWTMEDLAWAQEALGEEQMDT